MLLDSLAYLLSHPVRFVVTALGLAIGLIALGHWLDRTDNDQT